MNLFFLYISISFSLTKHIAECKNTANKTIPKIVYCRIFKQISWAIWYYFVHARVCMILLDVRPIIYLKIGRYSIRPCIIWYRTKTIHQNFIQCSQIIAIVSVNETYWLIIYNCVITNKIIDNILWREWTKAMAWRNICLWYWHNIFELRQISDVWLYRSFPFLKCLERWRSHIICFRIETTLTEFSVYQIIFASFIYVIVFACHLIFWICKTLCSVVRRRYVKSRMVI